MGGGMEGDASDTNRANVLSLNSFSRFPGGLRTTPQAAREQKREEMNVPTLSRFPF